ncbi:MAG TPA: CocE/NonD family hydrolase C-terminal non-catalytic domain-containing protein, partial [Actinomycetota bacterium]|nr:CocE/NonD family hydrolase C-terminal non-catalytic domain-containing protein [Actinomycetota bacterium]
KLVDVAPDGFAQRIVEGIVAVPQTGSREGAQEAVVDLGSTGYRVREGHRLRLEVATSCFPRFAVHPGTGEDPMLAVGGSPSDQGLLVGGSEGSAVSLTVI